MDQSANQAGLRNIVSASGTGRHEKVLGVEHVYRLEEQQTNGALACIETTVPPGHGVPPHTHHLEDEIFYVAEGCVEINGDDLPEPMTITQGAIFYSPRGRMHSFHNAKDASARLIIFMTPGTNMQRMFAALASLTSHAEGKPAPADVTALCAKFDIDFLPPAR
jgi:quercetin dioxygenase-like cupin family protein